VKVSCIEHEQHPYISLWDTGKSPLMVLCNPDFFLSESTYVREEVFPYEKDNIHTQIYIVSLCQKYIVHTVKGVIFPTEFVR
jgi:hypothetical protein